MVHQSESEHRFDFSPLIDHLNEKASHGITACTGVIIQPKL